MAKVLKYGKGRGSIEIDGLQRDLILETLKKAEPIILSVLEDETEKLAKSSEDNWLVRQSKYGQSKGSKFAHRTGIRILPPYTIEAFVENTAEYAWAIKIGAESETNLRRGQRLADKVLWSPAKQQADKILQRIAMETIKNLRRL